MKQIQLGHHQKGREYKYPLMWALVDDADFEELNKYRWRLTKPTNVFYAISQTRLNGKPVTIMMHTQIMQTPTGLEVDHVDGNGLNNQRSNLRVCTHSQNQMNRGIQSNNKSGLKGVIWHKRDKHWQANIRVNGKQKHLGNFSSPELAHVAYVEACKKYHGEFAHIIQQP